MRLGFSTLSCPQWTLVHACSQARALGYDGIELRLIDGQLVTPEPTAQERERVRATLADSGQAVSAFASSIRLAAPDSDATERELRATLALASDWSIPRVRVFGGRIPDGESRDTAMRRAAAVVQAVLPEAERLACQIALETHDDFSAAAHAAALLEAVAHPGFVAVWDLQHTWRAGDSPAQAWSALGPYVAEIQVKDGAPTAGQGWRQAQLGEGEIPFRDCVAVACEAGFDDWLVVEWEKHWHPELADPEVALPAHRTALANLLAELGSR